LYTAHEKHCHSALQLDNMQLPYASSYSNFHGYLSAIT